MKIYRLILRCQGSKFATKSEASAKKALLASLNEGDFIVQADGSIAINNDDNWIEVLEVA